MKVVAGSTETLGLLKTLYIYFYAILTRVTFLFLNRLLSILNFVTRRNKLSYVSDSKGNEALNIAELSLKRQ